MTPAEEGYDCVPISHRGAITDNNTVSTPQHILGSTLDGQLHTTMLLSDAASRSTEKSVPHATH